MLTQKHFYLFCSNFPTFLILLGHFGSKFGIVFGIYCRTCLQNRYSTWFWCKSKKNNFIPFLLQCLVYVIVVICGPNLGLFLAYTDGFCSWKYFLVWILIMESFSRYIPTFVLFMIIFIPFWASFWNVGHIYAVFSSQKLVLTKINFDMENWNHLFSAHRFLRSHYSCNRKKIYDVLQIRRWLKTVFQFFLPPDSVFHPEPLTVKLRRALLKYLSE